MNHWTTDILGKPFEARTIDHRDGSRCTVVRLSKRGAKRGILYIHGFSDYFFQAHMAREFHKAGLAFYAVDLRRYGRSLRQGEAMFEIAEMTDYFADIESAAAVMRLDGISKITLMGHSTGGLTASLYMAVGHPVPEIDTLVLNSPFLDWNMPLLLRRVGVPAVSALGRFFPKMRLRQPDDMEYARSLSKSMRGEWDYNQDWKPYRMPDPDAAWVRAIQTAQSRLMKRAADIKVPVLLLRSDKSAKKGDPTEKFGRADAILDVDLISRRGRRLGAQVTEIVVHDGLHDLSLSRPDVRRFFFNAVIDWLADK
nr:alpha/beta hydrolase [Bacteroides sp.]